MYIHTFIIHVYTYIPEDREREARHVHERIGDEEAHGEQRRHDVQLADEDLSIRMHACVYYIYIFFFMCVCIYIYIYVCIYG